MKDGRIRILHVILAPGIGGMENRIARLAAGLDRSRFEVEVLSFRPPPGATLVFPEGTRHHVFPIPSGLHLRRLLALAAFIRRGGYDVVHSHNWATMFYGILAGRLALRPIVLHGEHGLNRSDLAGTPAKRRLAQSLLARLAHRVVAVNAPIAAFVRKEWALPAGKLEVIVNGVDLGRFAPAVRPSDASRSGARRSGAGDGSTYRMGMVGRMDDVKDIGCALRALRALRQQGKADGLRLALVGDGPLVAPLAAEAESLGVADLVEFAGPRRDVEKCYGSFDLYLNTSVYEGMSNTLLEAMASGLPLVVSRVPGNAAWITEGEDALFFAPGDAEALAARILELRENPARAEEMGRRNRRKVEERFDNRNFIAAYAALYGELLGTGGGTTATPGTKAVPNS